MIPPEIRVHPEEGWIAVRDRPDSPRPWAKVVPGVSLTDEDVTDWLSIEPMDTPAAVRILAVLHDRLREWGDNLSADLDRLDDLVDPARSDERADVVGQLSMLRAVRQVIGTTTNDEIPR